MGKRPNSRFADRDEVSVRPLNEQAGRDERPAAAARWARSFRMPPAPARKVQAVNRMALRDDATPDRPRRVG